MYVKPYVSILIYFSQEHNERKLPGSVSLFFQMRDRGAEEDKWAEVEVLLSSRAGVSI